MEATFIIRLPKTTGDTSLTFDANGTPELTEGDLAIALEVAVVPPVGSTVIVPTPAGNHNGPVLSVVQNFVTGTIYIEVGS